MHLGTKILAVLNAQMKNFPILYKKWLDAFRALGARLPRGWQAKLAETVGKSVKHISMVYNGHTMASPELQQEIADFLQVSVLAMVTYGADIVNHFDIVTPFPNFHYVLSLPKDKRFDAIVEIVSKQVGLPFIVYYKNLKEQYENNKIDEVALYKQLLQNAKRVKLLIEKTEKTKDVSV